MKEANFMEMKSPPHPGELIGDSLEGARHVDQRSGERPRHHATVASQSYCRTQRRHAGNGCRFEKALGSTADTWLRVQMNCDLAQIRKRAHPSSDLRRRQSD
jgi:plasmid maintenance system antidote protein VapI